MKVTPPRNRCNSEQAKVQAMQAAQADMIPIPPVVTMDAEDEPFWRAVTEARPRSTWTTVDLILAATLARCMRDLEQFYSGELEMTPSELDKLTRRTMAMARQLHVHALATVGRSGDAAGLAELERQARGQELDDLIPMGGA